MPTFDAHAARLHAAGWSAGDFATDTGWIVIAVNGENVVTVRGDTQAEAWQKAVEEARAKERADAEQKAWQDVRSDAERADN